LEHIERGKLYTAKVVREGVLANKYLLLLVKRDFYDEVNPISGD